MNARNKMGRYDISKMDARCACGHTLGQHLAGMTGRAASPRPCNLGPHGDLGEPGDRCTCIAFKKSKGI